ncbi:hypothetical protein AAGV28_07165 [Flavobacterium sp. FZUC8N2.13]|uniref:Uncharacterized protein n=1 Tax=Flavobacterium zubiriense TaxID=3138075 RepID=A0ABV4TB07_9FLAO
MNIEYVGNGAIVDTPDVAFTYQVSETPRELHQQKQRANDLEWNNCYNPIGDYLVFPYGVNDDLPDIIKEVVQTNSTAPGILKKKTQLIWGMGPQLYKEQIKEGKLTRVYTEDAEIKSWLESWDYESYLLKSCTDYQHLEGVFSKFELSKGGRIGQPTISRIEHLYPDRTRKACKKDSATLDATHAITAERSFRDVNGANGYKIYPLFDFKNPFANKNAIFYSNMYSFCTDYYTVPDLYGSIEWLRRSTAVPLIFKALSKNSINLKYHIISPQVFWDKKKEEIEANCEKSGVLYKASMLLEYQRNFLEKIAVVLSGDENTGKYMHTTKSFYLEGVNLVEAGWEIKTIDQNMKNYVESQIAISNHANHALSSGLNLHSALGNVSETGKSDSGSEQIYALKTFLQTGIDIPEIIIMKAINYALLSNFPKKGLKLGFYHENPEKEQDITPKNRIINQ